MCEDERIMFTFQVLESGGESKAWNAQVWRRLQKESLSAKRFAGLEAWRDVLARLTFGAVTTR